MSSRRNSFEIRASISVATFLCRSRSSDRMCEFSSTCSFDSMSLTRRDTMPFSRDWLFKLSSDGDRLRRQTGRASNASTRATSDAVMDAESELLSSITLLPAYVLRCSTASTLRRSLSTLKADSCSTCSRRRVSVAMSLLRATSSPAPGGCAFGDACVERLSTSCSLSMKAIRSAGYVFGTSPRLANAAKSFWPLRLDINASTRPRKSMGSGRQSCPASVSARSQASTRSRIVANCRLQTRRSFSSSSRIRLSS
mmetsp:Transcript_35814/g.71015  ORF Transcript_35814/g.71015 Transcript_35814/m.71015 type:complete len:254 (-) Transcript_35814:423-1184(-)